MIKIECSDPTSGDGIVQIEGFPSYRVDRGGNIYNSKMKALKPGRTTNGYLRVSLNNETVKRKRCLVHRIVAQAFIPNPDNLTQVNHIDRNKTNNNVENLEWCTPLENLLHSNVIEKASKAKFRKVQCITTGRVYNSIKEAALDFGASHGNIVACCAGRRKKCGGAEWKYAT